MSIFTNAHGFEVQGGTFTATTTTTINNNNTAITNNYQNGPTGIDILREASAPEAAHDSTARTYSPRCFAGTREQYIEDITHWANPSLSDPPQPIYWMKGPAGVGKSAIAQTCTENLHQEGMLGAAFFFSISGQHNPETFFPSIAYQLSTVHPAYRDLVDKKIRNDRTVVNKALQFQFRYLIDEPLRELEQSGKGIKRKVQVFVDGLDECEGTDAQCEIVRIIAAAVSDGVIPLRWAFFSRPEAHLEAMFSRVGISPHCYKVILPISRDIDGEIELYLRNGFNNILERRNTSPQTPWPTADDMTIVVEAAGGLFIYATTVIRFVGHPDSIGPQKRLRVIIDVILDRRERGSPINPNTDSPFAELDAFYTLILQRVPLKIRDSVHLFLAFMSEAGWSGAMSAANLLGLSKDEFETVCNHVSAVVYFTSPDEDLELDPTHDLSSQSVILDLGGEVGFYHNTFHEFLVDPERSGIYCVESSTHVRLAKQYVKIHLDLDRSFCWRGSELVLAPGFPNSAASLSYSHTNELVNSILKTHMYMRASVWVLDLPAPGEPYVNCDFRKCLYAYTNSVNHNHTSVSFLCGCPILVKDYPGTEIQYAPRHWFDTTTFKSAIEQQKRANIIRRYHLNLTSRVKSLFRKESRGVESGLYRLGHGEKSVFWYYEINHRLQYYRGFRAIDLAEGKRIFEEQDFDLGSEWRMGEEDEGQDGDKGGDEGSGENRDEDELNGREGRHESE